MNRYSIRTNKNNKGQLLQMVFEALFSDSSMQICINTGFTASSQAFNFDQCASAMYTLVLPMIYFLLQLFFQREYYSFSFLRSFEVALCIDSSFLLDSKRIFKHFSIFLSLLSTSLKFDSNLFA